MFDFVAKGIAKLVGSKNDKDLKELKPYVGKINAEFEKLASISNDQLRAKTDEIKAIINAKLKSIDDEVASLKSKIESDSSLDIHQKDEIFTTIDELEDKRNEELEVVLLEVLPLAFAVIKETARRFTENEFIEVTATDKDKLFASEFENVELSGDSVKWHSTWKAAGVPIKWEMVHYDVQLIGGVVLHTGKIAEMSTGEGKTLVSTLPSYLNALAGRGVHLITVNDYLAKRDSEWMAPIFQFHGLTVDCIDKYEPHSPERVKAYNSDITYGTNNEFGFDYLRDNMSKNPDELVQRKHHFAMVDEVDSVLIDDARTPLIISGPVPKGDEHEFDILKPRIAKLVEVQRKITADYLNDAKKAIKNGDEKEASLPLFRAFRGLPKHKPLIKFLGEPGMKALLQKVENDHLADNQRKMPEADLPLYFTIDEKSNSIDLTDKGIDLITSNDEDANFFILPDIGVDIDKVEKDDSLDSKEKVLKKEEIIQEYSKKTSRIHSVNQLLKAYTLFEKDTEYILSEGKVKIVDEQTGRIMDGRRYSDGLHQAIEAKENVKIENATQTHATVTLQNYFRMYHKLAGMTGTAETEAGEFWEIYELDVVVIPTNRGIQRDDRQDLVYRSVREKFNAVIEECVTLTKAGRPVLVGTTSVEISEVLSRMLKMRNIDHQVLNAKQHAKEADVVAKAGQPGVVTIATNMAGRGTDIKLTPESKAAGGLAIIGTERHESRRVDRQLRGRAGRQGDVGSSQFFVSLEDNLMRLFGSDRIAKVMDRLGYEEGEVIQHSMISKSIERAQKKVEENNFGIRKRLLEYDDIMNAQREVIYKRRRNALHGERLEMDILNMIYVLCEKIITQAKTSNNFDDFKLDVIKNFVFESKLTSDAIEKGKIENLTDTLFDEAMEFYRAKNKVIRDESAPVFKDIQFQKGTTVENIVVPFESGDKQITITTKLNEAVDSEGKSLIDDLHKITTLAIIDQEWIDHLREMDDLQQSVRNATYEQKDPLLIYKFEGFNLFDGLRGRIRENIISLLFKATIPIKAAHEVREAREAQRTAPKLSENKQDSGSLLNGGGSSAGQQDTREAQSLAPAKSQKVAGRNQRVKVQYQDGTVKEGVKFKSVENDVLANKCVVLEVED